MIDDNKKFLIKNFLRSIKGSVMAMDVDSLKDDQLNAVYNSLSNLGLKGGSIDFENLTEEEQMKIRKELGLYYTEIVDNTTNSLYANPNYTISGLPGEGYNDGNATWSKIADEIPLIEGVESIDNYNWEILNWDEGAYWDSNGGDYYYLTEHKDSEDNILWYSFTQYGYTVFYFSEDIKYDGVDIEKGFYLPNSSSFMAIRLVSINEEESSSQSQIELI